MDHKKYSQVITRTVHSLRLTQRGTAGLLYKLLEQINPGAVLIDCTIPDDSGFPILIFQEETFGQEEKPQAEVSITDYWRIGGIEEPDDYRAPICVIYKSDGGSITTRWDDEIAEGRTDDILAWIPIPDSEAFKA